MSQSSPILLWFRRDLRLTDHPALCAAVATGRPIIPVYIRDPLLDNLGAAPKWRLGLGIEDFARSLRAQGTDLILRTGDALTVLRDLIRETGADTVFWSRAYDTDAIARDTKVKAALIQDGIVAQSHKGCLLFEPWAVKNKTGTAFKVYSPYWRCVSRDHAVAEALPAPANIAPPNEWPDSERLDAWELGAAMRRGANVVLPFTCVGAAAAHDRLHDFLDTKVDGYKEKRNFPGGEFTSRLSENLTYGEISPRTIWHAGRAAMERGAQGAEHFLKELVWREFAYHLLYEFPQLSTQNWRPEWNNFIWRGDNSDATAWQRGETGVDLVDAGMRELYVTGTMHNRVRMVAASYLTKHLRTDWRVGLKWFEDCLIDWDPAANAMGWQWVAGCGPDAAPYFRVFNPDTQAEKFDPDAGYRNRFLDAQNQQDAQAFFAAVPKSWEMDTSTARPKPLITLREGRESALKAYEEFKALKG